MGEMHKRFVVKRSYESIEQCSVDLLLDSGATYSLIPRAILEQLGINPHRSIEVVLADGRRSQREVGDAYLEYQGSGSASPVIFGESGEEPLLGVFALESLGYVLDPFKREIYPGRTIRL